MLPLIVGTVLAACGLAFVLLPLLTGRLPLPPSAAAQDGGHAGAQGTDEDGGAAAEITAVEVLREIEFDRATGKLSEADYSTLKSTYTARALAELRAPVLRPEDGSPAVDTSAGPGARRLLCPMCAATSPPDAVYCSRCAHFLAGQCPTCHGPVTLPAARYCSWCGARVAARERRTPESRKETTAIPA
jgi:hypothetical protein